MTSLSAPQTLDYKILVPPTTMNGWTGTNNVDLSAYQYKSFQVIIRARLTGVSLFGAGISLWPCYLGFLNAKRNTLLVNAVAPAPNWTAQAALGGIPIHQFLGSDAVANMYTHINMTCYNVDLTGRRSFTIECNAHDGVLAGAGWFKTFVQDVGVAAYDGFTLNLSGNVCDANSFYQVNKLG